MVPLIEVRCVVRYREDAALRREKSGGSVPTQQLRSHERYEKTGIQDHAINCFKNELSPVYSFEYWKNGRSVQRIHSLAAGTLQTRNSRVPIER